MLISTALAIYAATPHSGSTGILFTSARICSSVNENRRKQFFTSLAVIAFFLPTAVMLVMYALIFVLVHKRQKMLRNGELGQSKGYPNVGDCRWSIYALLGSLYYLLFALLPQSKFD